MADHLITNQWQKSLSANYNASDGKSRNIVSSWDSSFTVSVMVFRITVSVLVMTVTASVLPLPSWCLQTQDSSRQLTSHVIHKSLLLSVNWRATVLSQIFFRQLFWPTELLSLSVRQSLRQILLKTVQKQMLRCQGIFNADFTKRLTFSLRVK